MSNENESIPIEMIQIKITTKGDYYSSTPFPYKSNVPIFFTTTLLLDEDILKANKIDIDESLFLKNDVFEKAINILEEVSVKKNTKNDIIKTNIELFRKVFFPEKKVITIKNERFVVVTSKYKPGDSINLSTVNTSKGVKRYEITFELYVLNERRALKDSDFSKSTCKLKASELNKQAKNIFGVSLGLDDKFPPLRAKFSISPTSYGNISQYGRTNNSISDINTNEVFKIRQDIRLWLKDYYKKKESKLKDENVFEWQRYKDNQIDQGLPVEGMNIWISNKEKSKLENKYKTEWLKYKSDVESNGNQANIEKWLKDKLEEERENKVDKLMREWVSYKKNQTLLGQKYNMNDWLSDTMKTEERNEKDNYSFGGKKKHNRKYTRKYARKYARKHNRNNKKYTSCIKKKKHSRSYSRKKLKNNKYKQKYTKKKHNIFDTSKVHPASIII